jgi:hypothetical protein
MPRTGPTTRRSVSIRGASYDKLLAYAQERSRSAADIVEEHIAKLTGTPWPLENPGPRKGPRAPRSPASYKRPRVMSLPPTEGEPLVVTPPADIDDKPRKVSRFSAIPTARDHDKPRRLAIPEHTDDPTRSRPAPTPATFARRGGGSPF